MAKKNAIIGTPSSTDVFEDASNPNLGVSGTILISDPDPGQAVFNTTVVSARGNLGTLTLFANGQYSYSVADSAVQYLGADDTKVDTFTISSADGTTKQVSFTIHGVNDAAVIGTPTVHDVTEDVAVSKGLLTATGTISIVDPDQGQSQFKTTVVSSIGNLGTLTLSSNGSYTYSVSNQLVQFLGAGKTAVDTFTVTSLDGMTTKQVLFTINGANDAAVISGPSTGSVTEAGGVNNGTIGTPTATGTLTDTDVDSNNPANTFIAAAAGTSSTGGFGTYQMTSDGVWTYTLDNSKAAVQALKAGQTLSDSFVVKTVDGTAKTISITINGANDAAIISGPVNGTVTEAGGVNNGNAGTPTATGTLTDSDVDNPANTFTAAAAGTASDHGYGTYQMTSGGVWTYTLNNLNGAVQALKAGDQLTDTFTVKTIDGTQKLVTIAINGTNDAAKISGTSGGSVTEAGGVNNSATGTPTATGTLTDLDVDNAANSFAAVAAGTASDQGYGTYQMSSGGTWTYTLDNSNSAVEGLKSGEQLIDTFTVHTADGTAQQVSITIAGSDDVASIGNPSAHDVTEDVAVDGNGKLTATGSLSISDPDHGQNSFQTTVGNSAGNLGTLTIQANGNYLYSVDNGLTQYLSATDTKVDTFTVTSADGTTKQISFNVHGAQDAPNLSVGATATGASDVNIPLSISASLIDTSSTLTVQITGVPETYEVTNGNSLGDGVWAITGANPADLAQKLASLALIPHNAVSSDKPFTLHVTAISDDGAHQAATAADISVTVTAGANENNGQLIDGYIAGATIFADANGNGALDTGEVSTTSRADGSFTLIGGTGPLVSIGGTDVSTGLAVTGVLKAPEGSSVITPLTTLITALVAASVASDPAHPLSVDDAASAIKAAFNLDPLIDLQTFDPVPAAVNNDPAATAVLSAAIQVQSTVTQISAVGGQADSAFTAIAGAITAAQADPVNVTFDLSSSTTVQSVVSSTAGVDANAVAAVVSVVAVANGTIQSAGDITELAQASQVAQGATTQALASTDFSQPSEVSALTLTYADTDTVSAKVTAAVVGDVDGAQLGTLGDDTLLGGSGSDSIDGLDGNDHINGGGGNDFLYGSAGKDYLTGGAGDDLLDGGTGFDRAIYTDATGGITVNLAAGTASGAGVGTDTLVNVEAVIGSDFADTFNAAGFAGDSHVAGTPIGFNEFEGKGGDDIITSNVNSQGAELTRVSYVSATAGVTVDIAAGYAQGDASVGHDTFIGNGIIGAWGSAFDDTIKGSNNPQFTAEVFSGFAGNDLIDGRGGFDRVDYNVDPTTTSGITVNMAAGTVVGDATIGTDTLRAVEAVRGTNFADTYDATGFSGSSTNAGSLGTFNEFTGNGGNDTIIGNGNTRLGFNNATAGVNVDFVTGIATGDASVGTDTFTGVNAVQASMFDDTLQGGATNDTFTGLAGNDYIDGRGGFDVSSYNNIFFTTGGVTVDMAAGIVTGDASNGTDTLRSIEGIQGTNFVDTYVATGYGQAGAANVGNNLTFNQFEGLAGDDTITGNGNTRVIYTNATSGVTINLAAGTASGDASVGHDTFTGVNSGGGSNFADTFDATGFVGFNAFQGLGGNDVIIGNGSTQVAYNNAGGAVTVNLLTGTTVGDASVGSDTFTGVNNVFGSNFGDTIIGGNSNDFLTGNGGADTFVYATGGHADLITDFSHAQGDKINLSGVYGVFGFGDLQITQQGANTFISFGNGDSLTLQNVNSANLVAGDFIFTQGVKLTGDANPNTLTGTAYTDSLSGLDGNDRLQGLGGNDLLDGGLGFDRAIYTDATGGITVNLAAGTASGAGVGTDTLVNIDGIVGSDFADTYNSAGFTANSGIAGTPIGYNEFEGRGGDDIITSNVNSQGAELTRVSYVSATAGVTVDIAAGYAQGDASVGHDTLIGSGFNGAWGSAFADTILGSNNPMFTAEVFAGFAGDDLIDGRGGFDRADYNVDSTTTLGITVNMASGIVTGDATIGTDTLRSVEAVRGTNFADTYDATGFSSTSTNASSLGTFNEFTGNGGNDTITGNGNTRLGFNNATAGVNVDFVTGIATGDASVGTDTFTGVNAVQASMFDDTLQGGATNDTFTGLAGNDYIDGRGGFDVSSYNNIFFTTGGVSVDMAAGTVTGDASSGTDTLRNIEGIQGTNFVDTYVATGYGQAGAQNVSTSNGSFNQFEGLAGDDTITGNGNTRVIYTNATSGVTINLAAGSATGDASVGHDTFTGVNSGGGSNFADTFDATGFVGFNAFQGLGGNDTIIGNGSTQVAYNNAGGAVTVNLITGTTVGDASVGTDTFTGVNNVFGSNFGDTIIGGSTNDSLTGNGGADTFVYATGGGADFITDFNHGQGDKIDVTGVSGIFSLADIQAHATQQGNNTLIDFGGGDTITLQNVTAANLVASDFVFNNSITGTSGPDTLVGTNQIDGIFGLAGNDRLQGLGGNDLLDGGLGFDRAIYTDATGGITVNLTAGTASGAGVGTDTLVNIEAAVGSNFADTFDATGFTGLSGNAGGSAGQSAFEGMGGDDLIIGYINAQGQKLTRVDYLSASAAVTVDIAAGTGQGTAAGDAANVGHDTFSNISTIFGSAYNDTLYGSDNPSFTYETFEGRGGDDYIDGRGGYDMVTYNNDTTTTSGITVHLAAGTVTGDATVGTDTIRNVEAVRGTNFADVFDATGYGVAGALNVSTTNGTFNDFAGAGGNDTIIGNGNTRLNYAIAAASVSVDLETSPIGTTNAVTVAGSATGTTEGTDTFTGVNAVQGSTFNDTLLGSSFNNTFTGLAGDDYIDGRGGFDTASFNSLGTATGGVTVNMAAGTATGDASIGTDTLRSIEGIQGTMFADSYDATGFGSGANIGNFGNFNQFEGLGGDDTIIGNGNTKVLYGNSTAGVTITINAGGAGTAHGTAAGDVATVGNDVFTGGVNAAIGSNFADVYDAHNFNGGFNGFQGNAGDDTITGNGATQVQYGNATTSGVTITINAGGSGTASGDSSVGNDTFVSGVNSAVGSNFADSYNAASYIGFNSFQGQGGNDAIIGNGSTQIQFNNASAGVTVDLAAGTADGDGSVGHDTFSGVNNVFGSNFGDTILGTSGTDFLNGGNGGNDILTGRGGSDILTGGGGADTFVFNSASESTIASHATITDFSHSQGDKIDLTNIAGVNATPQSVQGMMADTSANVLANSIAWVEVGGNTIVYVNTTNADEAQGSAQMEIILSGINLNLSLSDFHHI